MDLYDEGLQRLLVHRDCKQSTLVRPVRRQLLQSAELFRTVRVFAAQEVIDNIRSKKRKPQRPAYLGFVFVR